MQSVVDLIPSDILSLEAEGLLQKRCVGNFVAVTIGILTGAFNSIIWLPCITTGAQKCGRDK